MNQGNRNPKTKLDKGANLANGLTFRQASESDRTYLQRLFFLTAVYGDESASIDASYMKYRELYVDNWDPNVDCGMIAIDPYGVPLGGCWLRFWTDSQNAGCANLGEHTPELALAVEPRVNGQGLGRKLLEQGVELARSKGAAQVALHVEYPNVRARKIYQNFGFEEVGSDPDDTGVVMVHQI